MPAACFDTCTGPGRANEHADPHLVAGFSDPAELEPERLRGGSPDLRRLAGLLAQPLAVLGSRGGDKPVWHCSMRAAPEDQVLSDGQWAQVAAEVMHRTGLAQTSPHWPPLLPSSAGPSSMPPRQPLPARLRCT
jgi:hypothetical protein